MSSNLGDGGAKLLKQKEDEKPCDRVPTTVELIVMVPEHAKTAMEEVRQKVCHMSPHLVNNTTQIRQSCI